MRRHHDPCCRQFHRRVFEMLSDPKSVYPRSLVMHDGPYWESDRLAEKKVQAMVAMADVDALLTGGGERAGGGAGGTGGNGRTGGGPRRTKVCELTANTTQRGKVVGRQQTDQGPPRPDNKKPL